MNWNIWLDIYKFSSLIDHGEKLTCFYNIPGASQILDHSMDKIVVYIDFSLLSSWIVKQIEYKSYKFIKQNIEESKSINNCYEPIREKERVLTPFKYNFL